MSETYKKPQFENLSAIEIIIQKIGNDGPFQQRFLLLFNMGLMFCGAMPYLNLIISSVTPNHWCHVPGREFTNYTMNQWKNLTIPMELDSKNMRSYSKCERFLFLKNESKFLEKTIKCDQGWDYDHTWYEQTASMKNNWVCDDDMIPANAIAIGFLGEVVGNILFGFGADIYGRKPIIFITLSIVICGRILLTISSSWVYGYYFLSFFASLSSVTILVSCITMGTEIASVENRAFVSMVTCIFWNFGCCMLPIFLWWLRDWVTFILVTTLPSCIFLFCSRWFIESPRWLASKGKVKQCIHELQKMAKVNKTNLPIETEDLLFKFREDNKHEKPNSVLGLFSSMRLARNCIILNMSWAFTLQINMFLTINVGNLEGNPFVNYILLYLVDTPAFFIGKWACDRYGRRLTGIVNFFCITIGCVCIIFLINDNSYATVVRVICVLMRFASVLESYSASVQCLEIYPTCIRLTGQSLMMICGSAFSSLVPYVVSLGVNVSAMLPYCIFGICGLTALIGNIFLPETNGCQLPETLADAANFGANQDIWGRIKPRSDKLCSKDGADIFLDDYNTNN